MQTAFSLAQLADPAIQSSNDILRKCVHCGFCTATCPTYVLLGDERDSPEVFRRLAQRLARELPRGEHVELPGASHMVHEDAPEAFEAALLSFLGRGEST